MPAPSCSASTPSRRAIRRTCGCRARWKSWTVCGRKCGRIRRTSKWLQPPTISCASTALARWLAAVRRNMSDEIILAIARKGGVICVNFSVAYLDKKAYDTIWPVRANRQQEVRDVLQQHAGDPQRWDLARAIERRYYKMIPNVDLRQLLRHIDHVAKVAGSDHV